MRQKYFWRYANIVLLLLSLVIAGVIIRYDQDRLLDKAIGQLGYFGVFISGVLFVSTFTVAPAAALLFEFARNLNPATVALAGGLGAAIGDYFTYRFIRDKIFTELNPVLKTLHLYRRIDILHTKYFAWLAPVLGTVIIASPFPDELGLSLLGLKKIKQSVFLLIVFIINSVGIYLIALAARAGN